MCHVTMHRGAGTAWDSAAREYQFIDAAVTDHEYADEEQQ